MRASALRRLRTRLGLEWELAPPLSRAERAARDDIDTVVIALGSYRNLTSLTAACYALHSAAIALNHAWIRLATKPHAPADQELLGRILARRLAGAADLAATARRFLDAAPSDAVGGMR